MKFGRRALLKGAIGTSASLCMTGEANDNLADKVRNIKLLKSGYYTVDGWVLTEREVQLFRGGLHD